jgi:hypothetical protein
MKTPEEIKSKSMSMNPSRVLLLLMLLLSAPLSAPLSAQPPPAAVPLQLYFAMPLPLQTNITYVTNNYYATFITNITQVTQVITNIAGARLLVDMTNNVLASPPPRTDLFKDITGPTTFTLGAFPPGSLFVLHLRNPSSFPITWPAGIWPLGSLPTNEVRSAVVFEEVKGEIWVSR